MAIRGTRAFTDVEELERRIEDYFDGLWETRRIKRRVKGKGVFVTERVQLPPTLSGLASHLDVSRNTLLNYSKRDEFVHVIARAKQRIAAYLEQALFRRETARGAMFLLRVNHGYGKRTKCIMRPSLR